ncbi:MAG: T9SS type A sorting domain-containing protein [Saprospiraceae bacterium]|nr:T9SS type A sorting domain-containing protein [Saprospiraceae bacterium]HMW39869.1 T9SS type A sorting domain-containing protein [Saprospiraceae bacterium]HMX89181.1 T9SS type A sorting domain-containing protein [Saprospiraceae bacterium]HMZ40590.1 T9SS type A sorting domain-containing protein [Saprospiraceae bacterium]HNA65233.1 T9SS type A sorting domain-containing protein [Saprospiraceae bacterium]
MKLLSFFLLFLSPLIRIASQCTPASSDLCDDSNVLCSLDELNGYTCRTADYSNPSGCKPLCNGTGVPYNMSWWAFVTNGGQVCLTIKSFNCQYNRGIQAGIWGDCECNESVTCDVDCTGGPGTKTICATLKSCKTYYFFVDGCTGDYCEFTVLTAGGAAPVLPPIKRITGPTKVCKGACNVGYAVSLDSVKCDPTWHWTLDGAERSETDDQLSLDFDHEGDFVLCATAIIGNQASGSICNQEGPFCTTIKVEKQVAVSMVRTLCAETLPYDWFGNKIYYDTVIRKEFADTLTCCLVDSVMDFRVVYNDSFGCRNSNYVQGLVYFDSNKDLIFNGNDYILTNYLLTSAPGNFATFSGSNGYSLLVERNSVNSVQVFLPPSPFLSVFPNDYTINVGNIYGKVQGSYDFAVQSIDYIDFEANLACTRARPGRIVIATLRVANSGTIAIDPQFVSMVIPAGWKVLNSDPVYDNLNNGTLEWNYSKIITSTFWKSFRVELEVPSTLTRGTPFEIKGLVNRPNDIIASNNMAICRDTIVTSYDPNDKSVYQDQITFIEGKYDELLYNIRFQNTGNDTAFDISVYDTIPLTLDPTTIRVVNASHACELEMPALRYFRAHFKNIMLPDSNVDKAGSQGFLQLAIRPIRALEVGSRILNSASIYFDFNDPVKTNTCLTKVINGITSTVEVINGIELYPVPARELIAIQCSNPTTNQINEIKIFDLSGRLANYLQPLTAQATVDLSSLAKGVYLVRVVDLYSRVHVRRVVKD